MVLHQPDDSKEETWDCATQHPIFLCDCWHNHDDCEGAEAPVIKNVHDCHCRECGDQLFFVISQGATTMNDGWLQQRRACQATTNQIFSYIAGASNDHKTTTSLMLWPIFYVLCCIARRYDNGNNGWSQQAREIAQVTTNIVHQCEQPHQWSWRREAPGIILIATPQQQCWWRNNHFYTVLWGATMIKKWMQGKDKYDSHVTIRIYMLLFAECDDDRIALHDNQQRKYTKVE